MLYDSRCRYFFLHFYIPCSSFLLFFSLQPHTISKLKDFLLDILAVCQLPVLELSVSLWPWGHGEGGESGLSPSKGDTQLANGNPNPESFNLLFLALTKNSYFSYQSVISIFFCRRGSLCIYSQLCRE